jgi:hypothetical protein
MDVQVSSAYKIILSCVKYGTPFVCKMKSKRPRTERRGTPCQGRAIAQAASRWLPTAAARVQTRV